MKDYQVKLFSVEKIKPVTVLPRSVPYHLQARVADSLENMIKNGVIEERPSNELAPWVSCAVIAPIDDGSLCVTLDARNLSKALISTNWPITSYQVQRFLANYILNLCFANQSCILILVVLSFFMQVINFILILYSVW